MLSEQELNALAKIMGVSFSFSEPVYNGNLTFWEAVLSRIDYPKDVLCVSVYKKSKIEAMNNAWANFMSEETQRIYRDYL